MQLRESYKRVTMSAPTFVYRALVIQYAPTDGPDYLWSNTYEFTSPAGLLNNLEQARSIANAFRTFHRRQLLPFYGVDRVVLSTYGPDLPAPPGFASFPYRELGTSNAGGRPLPLEVVAFIRKRVARGRNGKLFLRGVLTTNSIRGEEFSIDFGVDFISNLNIAATQLLNELEAADAELVLASGPLANVQTRTVFALEAVNARTLQYRTRRKTRLQQNALADLVGAYLDDGGITADEIPVVVRSLRRLFGSRRFPELPSP